MKKRFALLCITLLCVSVVSAHTVKTHTFAVRDTQQFAMDI